MKKLLLILSIALTATMSYNADKAQETATKKTYTQADVAQIMQDAEQADPIQGSLCLPGQYPEFDASQAAFEIVMKSFGAFDILDALNNTPRYIFFEKRKEYLKDAILRYSDENRTNQIIESLKNKPKEQALVKLEVLNLSYGLTLYAIDGLVDKIKLEEDKERYKHWLLYLEGLSEKIKRCIEIITNEWQRLNS
jgi:predicted lipoprotein